MNNFKLIKNEKWKEVEINGEIEQIPVDWKFSTIEQTNSKFIDGDRGSNYPSKNELTTIGYCVFLDAKNINKNNFSLTNLMYLSKEKDNKLRKGKLEKNDFIITTRGTLGNVAHYNESIFENIPNARINSGMVIFKPSNIFDYKYIYFFLRSHFWQNQIINDGGVIPQLTITMMKETVLYIPSLNQQSAISTILSKQEQVISDIEKLISKHESRFQYLSDELLSGKLRVKAENSKLVLYKNEDWKEVEINGEITEIPSDWQVDKIKSLFNCSMGQTILSKNVSQIYKDHLIPIYSATEEDHFFGYIEKNKIKNLLKENDIVIPARGNSIGFCKLMKNESTSTQTTIQLKALGKIDSLLVFYIFKKYKESFFPVNPGTIPQLTVEDVNRIEIIYMSHVEQTNIIKLLYKQENLIKQKKYLLNKEKQKFEWLLDNLLSGKYLIKEII